MTTPEPPVTPPTAVTPVDVVDLVSDWLTTRGHTPATDPASRHLATGAAAGLLLGLGVRLHPHPPDGRPIHPLPFSGIRPGSGPW